MTKKPTITDIQADILTTAMENGEFNGERIPWHVLYVCPTWTAPLVGLIKRGLLRKRRTNMYDVTPEGAAALAAWREYTPPMTVVR